MSQAQNPNIVTLTVTADAALFIIDCVADRPYKQVAPLLGELQAQVQVQANTRPGAEENDTAQAADDGAVLAAADESAADSNPTA